MAEELPLVSEDKTKPASPDGEGDNGRSPRPANDPLPAMSGGMSERPPSDQTIRQVGNNETESWDSRWKVGHRIQDRWEVREVKGGGMGEVYIVRDLESGALSVLKSFRYDVFERDPTYAQRFNREAIAWMMCDEHPNIVKAVSIERIHERLYLLIEYVDGGDLETCINQGQLSNDLPQVLRFAIQFCDGMIHASSRGLKVHRDIKPQNCLISQGGMLKVTDFGLAKVFDDGDESKKPEELTTQGSRDVFSDLLGDASITVKPPSDVSASEPSIDVHDIRHMGFWLTPTGIAAGTPAYMAPEQFDDAKSVDVRADVYSFGIMLFQMATGRPPFIGHSREEYERLHKTTPLPSLVPECPLLSSIIETCAAKQSSQRFADFFEVRRRLADVYLTVTHHEPPEVARGSELNLSDWRVKARNLSALGRYREAIDCYDRILQLDTRDATTWAERGWLLTLQLKDHSEARKCFRKAYHLGYKGAGRAILFCWRQSWPGVSMLVPWYLWALWHRYKNAQEWFMLGQEIGNAKCGRPVLSPLFGGYTIPFTRKRRLEKAIKCFDRAIEMEIGHPNIWTAKGEVLTILGRDEEALSCFDRALELSPGFPAALFNRGVALLHLKHHADAVRCLDRFLAVKEDSVKGWGFKGNVLHELKRDSEAITCYDRVLVIEPRSAGAWFKKGVILADSFHRHSEAAVCFEKAKKLGHRDASLAIVKCKRMIENGGSV